MRRELLGPQHPSTLVAQANLANYLDSMGRLAESEAMLRDVLAQSAGQPTLTMSSVTAAIEIQSSPARFGAAAS